MKTTLRELKKINFFNFYKLTSNLGTDDPDTEVTILEILNLNGIEDAVSALKTQKYKDYCLFLADVAESVLHLFEDKFPDDYRPRNAIEGIILFDAGKVTEDELNELRKDAYPASADIANTPFYTTHFADAYYASTAAYYASITDSISSGVHSISSINAAVTATSATHIITSDDAVTASKKKWKAIEVILRKYI